MKSVANGQKIKKIPERKCVGCGNSFPKTELIRVVRDNESTVFIDTTGKKSGRGAYICKSVKCFKTARKAKRLESNLDCSIPEEVYDRLEEELGLINENGK